MQVVVPPDPPDGAPYLDRVTTYSDETKTMTLRDVDLDYDANGNLEKSEVTTWGGDHHGAVGVHRQLGQRSPADLERGPDEGVP